MLPKRTLLTLIPVLCFSDLALAQETTLTDDASSTRALYAQNDTRQAQKTHTEKKRSDAASKKKSTSKKGKLSAEERFAELVKLANDVINALQSSQNGTAAALCRELVAGLTPDVNPDFSVSASFLCAGVYAENDRNEEELAIYDALEKRDLSAATQSKLCLGKSTVLTKMHRYEEAKTLMLQCPREQPYDAAIAGNLAELYMTMGDLQQAIDAYRQVVRDTPKNEHALYGLAAALARNGQWQDALAQFLKGVERDPAIRFMKSAFFVPKAENDYQKAFLQLALQRYDEAKFYLKRYVASEERPAYKAMGACTLDTLEKSDLASYTQYPVLLPSVLSAAIDSSARYLAFSNVDSLSMDLSDVRGSLWILDTQTGKTTNVLSTNGDFFIDAKFVGESSQLRVISSSHRYEIDAAQPQKGYYVYPNISKAIPIALTPSTNAIMSVSVENGVALAPWNSDADLMTLISVPRDTLQYALLYDEKTIAYSGSNHTSFVRIPEANDEGSPSKGIELASLPMQFDVKKIASHPNKPMFALAIESGTLLVDEKGSPMTLIGSPDPNSRTDVVAIDPTGKWLLTLSGSTAEIRSLDDVLSPPTLRWTCSAQSPLTTTARR